MTETIEVERIRLETGSDLERRLVRQVHLWIHSKEEETPDDLEAVALVVSVLDHVTISRMPEDPQHTVFPVLHAGGGSHATLVEIRSFLSYIEQLREEAPNDAKYLEIPKGAG